MADNKVTKSVLISIVISKVVIYRTVKGVGLIVGGKQKTSHSSQQFLSRHDSRNTIVTWTPRFQ